MGCGAGYVDLVERVTADADPLQAFGGLDGFREDEVRLDDEVRYAFARQA